MTAESHRPRLPRERLTEIVRDIARELSEQKTYDVTCRGLFGDQFEASFRIVAMWAFGSWARGAPTCGDVDLIVDFRKVGDAFPAERSVTTTIRRRRRYVDVHAGSQRSWPRSPRTRC